MKYYSVICNTCDQILEVHIDNDDYKAPDDVVGQVEDSSCDHVFLPWIGFCQIRRHLEEISKIQTCTFR